MPENFIIKYYYNNERMSGAAVAHIFRYLSAFSRYKFVEDKYMPVIWRDIGENIPLSARIIMGDGNSIKGLSSPGNLAKKGIVFITPDPVERIYEKLSIKTVLGPYSEAEYKPVNKFDESLGGIIKSFFDQLKSCDVIQLKENEISLWPEGYGFAVALTHDADIVRRSVRGSIKLLFKRDVPGGLRGLSDSLRSFWGRAKNPYDRISEWIDCEKRKGVKSTFFIFAGARGNKNDPKYSPGDLKNPINDIRKNGFELGLHTGIEGFKGDGMEESRKALSQYTDIDPAGIRPHYLSASLPDYWRAGAENGFDYSSCLGFDEYSGFHRGIDLPFMPFDIENDVPLEIVEIPIGIMDCGMIKNRGSNHTAWLDKGKKLIDRVGDSGGILVLDWHQRTMYNEDYPGWAEMFFDLVDYARNKGACFISLEETARLLKSRMAGKD